MYGMFFLLFIVAIEISASAGLKKMVAANATPTGWEATVEATVERLEMHTLFFTLAYWLLFHFGFGVYVLVLKRKTRRALKGKVQRCRCSPPTGCLRGEAAGRAAIEACGAGCVKSGALLSCYTAMQ